MVRCKQMEQLAKSNDNQKENFPTMTTQLAFIGCGGIAKRHVNVIRDLHERGAR